MSEGGVDAPLSPLTPNEREMAMSARTLSREEILAIPIPEVPGRLLSVREDRNGPGAKGFDRNEDCGCLMTLLCRNLGLVYNAQGGPGSWGAEALRAVLVHVYGANPEYFWSLVQTVQTKQDSAWNILVEAAMAQREPTELELADAKALMGEALAALRRLNVAVEWREGYDERGKNDAGMEYPPYEWLREVKPIEEPVEEAATTE